MKDRFAIRTHTASQAALWSLLAIVAATGCASRPAGESQGPPAVPEKVFALETIPPEKAAVFVAGLGLGEPFVPREPNAIRVAGSVDELNRAGTVLDLVDSNDLYLVHTLVPASKARTLPSNEQLAQIIGDVALGTFADPPEPNAPVRGLIDIHGEYVLAIVPMWLWPHVRTVVELGPNIARSRQETIPDEVQSAEERPEPAAPPEEPDMPSIAGAVESPEGQTAPQPEPPPTQESTADAKIVHSEPPASDPNVSPAAQVARGVLSLQPEVPNAPPIDVNRPAVPLDNGDDVIELTLPEKINLVQLVDLVGGYLGLDCIYDAEKLSTHTVTLKLHSKLQSEIRVKDLYTLLETILKFKGLAMTRHDGNLVTIVPADEALEVDPKLVGATTPVLQAGDMVVTRVFELRHVDVASVTNLLETMKLSVAISPIQESQTLFVTCYAHRMGRIAQLVHMVDRPGRPREFRFRPLKYTVADVLAQKVLDLAKELRNIPITIAPPTKKPAEEASRTPRRATTPPAPSDGLTAAEQPVYLDTDERTNRILMIGYAAQLATVEELIDTLDVPQQDVRTLTVYAIRNLDAAGVMDKLSALGIITKTTTTPAARRPARSDQSAAKPDSTTETTPGEEPQVVLLEATNSLLVNATREQHERIQTIIDYIDVSPEDLRAIKVYAIENVDAYDAMEKLYELGIVDSAAEPAQRSARSPAADTKRAERPQAGETSEQTLTARPQVVVLEGTNSLLANATEPQHRQLSAILQYVDVPAHDRALPYEVYFLENQDPEELAGILDKLVAESVSEADDKIVPVRRETAERIVFVPDKGTFSLVVGASRKNQEWIANLIERLDKRRPQVLIDATLVEITKTEAFTYDLNLIQSLPDLAATSGLAGTIIPGTTPVTSADILDKLATSGRSHFADYQSNAGDFTGFYGDKHVNLLLEAMQSKNYGRVLAKPKILVHDNQPGTIKTTDTTYVAKRSSIPVSSGGAGTDATLIETAIDYQSYEAGITLNITPHISQSELLRLDIELMRSDFRETEDPDRPPNTTASELKTTVFAPDGSTIILGGLVKLNQNKGGAKVPILGDVPIVGGLFRSVNNKDTQNKLYVFVKAEIIRPGNVLAEGVTELDVLSDRNRAAFEEYEKEFQNYQNWPGVKPKPVEPPSVLEAQ